MKRWCFDTSALSKPWQEMPADIGYYGGIWVKVLDVLTSGQVAVTKEIYDEMVHIQGDLGDCIRSHVAELQLEIGETTWDWVSYVANVEAMQKKHHAYISEYTGGRKGTVGLNDISIISLAKTLGLPVVSMEVYIRQSESKNRRIPNICAEEGIKHLTFNDFLRELGAS